MTNNVVFGKNIENVRKQEILKLSQQKGEITVQYQNHIVTLQSFFRTEKRKSEIIINKPVSLGLPN